MHVNLIEAREGKKKLEDSKTRTVCKQGRKRDETRELRGSTFSLAFVLAFAVSR